MQNNPKTRKKSRSGRRGGAVSADWNKANAEYIHTIIRLATKSGGAALFGCTRDGGAYSIKYYAGDGDNWTDYLPGSQDVNEWLRDIIDELDDNG